MSENRIKMITQRWCRDLATAMIVLSMMSFMTARANSSVSEVGNVSIDATNVTTISASADGRRAALSINLDPSILVVDVVAEKTLLAIDKGSVEGNAAAISPDGETLAYVNSEKSVVLVSTKKGDEVARVQIAQNPFSLVFSRDGKTLAIGCSEGHGIVFFWRPFEKDIRLEQLPNAGLKASRTVSAMAFSPNDRFFAFGTIAGDVVVWDREGVALAWEKRTGREWCGAVAFSPDGKLLAYQVEGSVQVVAVKTGKLLHEVKNLKEHSFLSTAGFSPDGKWLLFPRTLKDVGCLSVETKSEESLPIANISAVTFTGRGMEFLAGGVGSELRIFKLVTTQN